jgi:hypothetical protein
LKKAILSTVATGILFLTILMPTATADPWWNDQLPPGVLPEKLPGTDQWWLDNLPPESVYVMFDEDGYARLEIECKGKAFPWGEECWSRFEGQQFADWLEERGLRPEAWKKNYPELAKVFRQPWPPLSYEEELLLEVNEEWPRERNWDSVAQCETGQDWNWNSGTFQGALGFHWGAWDDFRPSHYPTEAYLASRAQQMIVADIIERAVGIGAWGCSGYAY